ncbi:MAG: hypothetical protein E7329_01585 [Clostridiales bacterium]|nr:hypothetical protein [Clostridiales bacterium]
MSSALYLVSDQPSFNLHNSVDYLAELYSDECQLPALPFVRRNLRQFLAEGFSGDLLAEAIKRTAMAPRPSWYYLNAIICNCRASHIFSLDDFLTKKHHSHGEDLPY